MVEASLSHFPLTTPVLRIAPPFFKEDFALLTLKNDPFSPFSFQQTVLRESGIRLFFFFNLCICIPFPQHIQLILPLSFSAITSLRAAKMHFARALPSPIPGDGMRSTVIS